MLFVAAAVLGAILIAFGGERAASAAPLFGFARALAFAIVNVYMVKMAGVFMISTSTVAFATKFAPRWLASLGVVLAVLLLFGSSFSPMELCCFSFVGASLEYSYFCIRVEPALIRVSSGRTPSLPWRPSYAHYSARSRRSVNGRSPLFWDVP